MNYTVIFPPCMYVCFFVNFPLFMLLDVMNVMLDLILTAPQSLVRQAYELYSNIPSMSTRFPQNQALYIPHYQCSRYYESKLPAEL